MSQTAVTLYDKHSERIIGTVLLNTDVDIETLRDRWDVYQQLHNALATDAADVYEFVAAGNWDICDVLEMKFYQP